jgi:hypothetical protein
MTMGESSLTLIQSIGKMMTGSGSTGGIATSSAESDSQTVGERLSSGESDTKGSKKSCNGPGRIGGTPMKYSENKQHYSEKQTKP